VVPIVGAVDPLRRRQRLVPQIMVAVDVCVPPRAARPIHRLQVHTRQLIHRRLKPRLGLGLRRTPGKRATRMDRISRCWQLDEPFPVHAQQRYPASHVLETAVRLALAEALADLIRQLLTGRLRMVPDPLPDPFDLFDTENSAALAFGIGNKSMRDFIATAAPRVP